MEALWGPQRSKYPDKQGLFCVCGQHYSTVPALFISIKCRVRRKLFVKRPPHFCSRELHRSICFLALLNNTVWDVSENIFKFNKQNNHNFLLLSGPGSVLLKLMSEGQPDRTERCQNNQSRSPVSQITIIHFLPLFLSLLWAGWEITKKTWNEGINSNQVKTPTPFQANPIIVRSGLRCNGDIRGVRNYPRDINK